MPAGWALSGLRQRPTGHSIVSPPSLPRTCGLRASRSAQKAWVLNSGNNIDESAADPTVLFTTIYDDTATATTTLVPVPINITGAATQPTLTSGMWGSVGIQSGAIAVI